MPQRRPVIADLIRNPEVRGRADNKTKQHRARHTGFKAVSTGRGHTKRHSSTSSLVTPANPHRHSRVGGNPQGGMRGPTSQNNRPSPLSLDGRGIKGEGENDASASSRHCGLDPQSRGEGAGLTTRQHNRPNPLSLDGRGIKGEGENDTPA